MNKENKAMKAYVCVKQTPDTAANIKIVGEAGYDESVKFVVNPYDEYAVEEAVRLVADKGGEVVVVSVGKPSAVNAIRNTLALGADRGILVKTDKQFLDSATTAMALKAAILQDGEPDVIFTGKQSVDTESMQTQYRLAAALGMPVANEVVSFRLKDDWAVVECEMGGGDRQSLELQLPCVLGATKGLNEPRYPKLPDIMKAKKKPVKEIKIEDLAIDAPKPAFQLTKLHGVAERGAVQMLGGETLREAVEKLVCKLHDEAKVIQ